MDIACVSELVLCDWWREATFSAVPCVDLGLLFLRQGRGFAFILVSLFTDNKISAHCLCLVGYNPPTLLDFHGLCPRTTGTHFLFQGCQVLTILAFGVLVSPFSSTLGGLLLFFKHLHDLPSPEGQLKYHLFKEPLRSCYTLSWLLYPTPNHDNFLCHCLERPPLGLCWLRVTPLGFQLSSLLRYPQHYQRTLFSFIKC